jgi:hypothetical protein
MALSEVKILRGNPKTSQNQVFPKSCCDGFRKNLPAQLQQLEDA